ncbi:MAG: Xaa-Pro peptidase family protein [Bacteroidota bacterium]
MDELRSVSAGEGRSPTRRPASRIGQLQAILGPPYEADALFISALHDIRWAVGFTGSNALLVVTHTAAFLLTDGRYKEQARREVVGAEVRIVSGELIAYVSENELVPAGGRFVIQSDAITVAAYEKLRHRFEAATFHPESGLLDAAVASKSPQEVAHVRAAQTVTDDVFDAMLPAIQPGITERQLAAQLTFAHLERGASAMSFEPIVASGPNSALPHARPTDRILQRGDVVLIDMGAYVEGYSSDMTRTVVLGPASDDVRHAYEAVLQAQAAAISTARAGMSGSELDATARDVLTEAGFGPQFTHSLGHGVGLRVHEWPRLSQLVAHTLPIGATVTIEPGVYFPGRFGIRIEDIIALHETGYDNLTRAPKALLELT